MIEGRIKTIRNDEGYAYPVTVAEAVYVDSHRTLKQLLKNLEFMMTETSESYVIDLEKWEVNNNPTTFDDKEVAKLTSLRINGAIEWAKEQGFLEITLPGGIYLIDEYNPIKIPSRTVFNLGGSTLRIRDNGLEDYAVILIENDTTYVRVTNGTIVGDKDTHDYDTINGSHEWGMGVSIRDNVHFASIDNMDISNLTGDAIFTFANPNFKFNVSKNWESGAIDPSSGSLKSSDSKVRLVNKFSLNNPHIEKYKRFGIYGDGWGRLGSDIHSETFDVTFYDEAEKFLSSIEKVSAFDDIEVPNGAAYASLVLYQGSVPSGEGDSVVMSIGVGLLPRNIYIENNNLHHSRRCGIAPTGRHIYITNNNIYSIRGGSPASVIDVEDAYKLNQFIHIEGNNLYDCRVGVSFVSSQNVFFTKNNMDRLGTSTVWTDCKNVIISNNVIHRCTWDLQGDAIFAHNNLSHARVQSRHKGKVIIDGNYLSNSEISLNNTLKYNTLINGNILYNDPNNGGKSTLGCYGEPQTIQNNEFTGDLTTGATDSLDWKFNNNKFLNTGNLSLCSGVYEGCTFDNAPIQFRTSQPDYVYEFVDCAFRNFKSSQFFSSYDQPMHLLRILNCRIYGENTPFIYFRDMSGRLEMIGNLFDYNTTAEKLEIIEFLTSRFTSLRELIVEDNRFHANAKNVSAMSSLKDNITPVIRFRNNTLDSIKQIIDNESVLAYGNVIDNVLIGGESNGGDTTIIYEGATSLGELTDVDMDTTAPIENDVLKFDGDKWTPSKDEVAQNGGTNGDSFTLQPATKTELGGVKIGRGIAVDPDGTISSDATGGSGNASGVIRDVILEGAFSIVGHNEDSVSFVVEKPTEIRILFHSGAWKIHTLPVGRMNIGNNGTLRFNVNTGAYRLVSTAHTHQPDEILLLSVTRQGGDTGQGTRIAEVEAGHLLKYAYLHGKGTARILTPSNVNRTKVNWNGRQSINIINDQLWSFDKNSDTGSVRVFNLNGKDLIKTYKHSRFHFNTSDYNPKLDALCTVWGWGTGNQQSSIKILHGVSNWKDTNGNGDYNIDDESHHDLIDLSGIGGLNEEGPQPVWGENNDGQNNIVYVTTEAGTRIRKLLLGKGDKKFAQGTFRSNTLANRFNGTFKILGEWGQINSGGRPQDGFLHNGIYYSAKDAGADSYGQLGTIIYKNHLLTDGRIEKEKILIETFDEEGNTSTGFSGGSTYYNGEIWMFVGSELVKFPIL